MSQNHVGILDTLTLESVDHHIPDVSFENFGFELLEIASLEASIKADVENLDNSVRMLRAMEAIDPSKLSVEAYRASMFVALHMAGIEDKESEIVATFESGTSVEDYAIEAEEKKQGFMSKMWAVIKRLYLAIKAKITTLFGLNKAKVEKMQAQQTAVEKKAKAAGHDYAKFHQKAANDEKAPEAPKPKEETPSEKPPTKPDETPTPKENVGGAKEPGSNSVALTLAFLGHTIADVIGSASKVAQFTHSFLDEIATAADKAAKLDYKTIRKGTGHFTNFPRLVTDYAKDLSLPSGTKLHAEFYYGGPKVEVIKGTTVSVSTKYSEIHLETLVAARRELIDVLAYKQSKLGHLQEVYDSLYPVFEKELQARDELGGKFKTPEWEATQPHWEKQEHVMRGIESVIGWIKGCIWSPVEKFVDPAVSEIDHVIGLRRLGKTLGRDK